MSMKTDFKTALSIVYRMRNFDEELSEPFLIYSRMSDLVGNDYENEKKLKLFFAVEKRVNLFAEIAGNADAKKLKRKYKSVSDLLSESAFKRLIDTLIESVNGQNGDTADLSDEADKSCADDSEEVSDVEEFPSSDTDGDDYDAGDYNYTPVKEGIGSKVFAGCLFGLSIAVLVLCGVLKTPWNACRWIVGITSMIIILIGSVALSEIIYEDVFNCVLLGVFAVTSFVLWCVFRSNYCIICYWVTPAVLIYGMYATNNAFDGCETACGWIDIGCCLLSVGTLLLNIFCRNFFTSIVRQCVVKWCM